MSHTVTLHGGGTIEVPESYTPEQVQSVVTQHLKDQGDSYYPDQKPMGAFNRAADVAGRFNKDFESLPGKFGDWLFNTINAAPDQIVGAATQLPTPRALKNLAIGASDVEKSTLNIPYNMRKYMAHLGLGDPNKVEDTLHMEHEPIGDYLRSTLGDERSGDALLQKTLPAVMAASPIKDVAGLMGKGIATAGRPIADSITGAPKYSALKEKLGIGNQENLALDASQRQGNAYAAHQAAQDETAQAKDAHQEAIAAAQQQGVKTNPNLLQNEIDVKNQKLTELNQNMSALTHQMDNIPPTPEAPKSDTSHMENAGAATAARQNAEQNLGYANQHRQLVTDMLPESDRQIAHHLNQGSDFPVNTSRQLRHEVESVNQHWPREYDNQMRDLEERNFQMLNPERAPQIREAIENARRDYGDDPHGDFANALRTAPRFESMNAHDFMRDQKQFRNEIHNLYTRARYEGRNGNPARADELFRAARALEPFEDLVNQTLVEGLGEHAPRYNEIQQGYRTQIYPLRNNATAQKVLSGEKLSNDIAGELAGDQEGQELLRGMANRNPQIQRNIVGQQYSKNADLIHNPDERLREYTNNMPELNQMVENRNHVQNSITQAQQNVQRATEQHAESIAREKESHEIAKTEQARQNDLAKDHVKQLAEREKLKIGLQKDMGKHYDEMKELEGKIPLLEAHMKNLNDKAKVVFEASKKEGITLKEKLKSQEELKAINRKRVELSKQLKAANFGYKWLYKKIGKKIPWVGGLIG